LIFKVVFFYIVGDGVGAASMACVALGKPYYSYEPNPIGLEARELGIISSDKPNDALLQGDCVVLLFNVINYIELDVFDRICSSIVIIDEGRCDPGTIFQEVKTTYGRVWLKNISLKSELVTFCYSGTRGIGMLKGRNNIPCDSKSEYLVKHFGYKCHTEAELDSSTAEEKKNFQFVGCYDEVGVLNLDTRNDPGRIRNAKKGDVKFLEDDYIEVFSDVVRYRTTTAFKLYEPLPYRDPRVLYSSVDQKGFIIGVSKNPEIVKWRVIDNVRQRIFYIQSVKFKGQSYGVYRLEAEMFGASHLIVQ